MFVVMVVLGVGMSVVGLRGGSGVGFWVYGCDLMVVICGFACGL